tara:strand:+ start:1152 stop:4403 length:3252 start_codon:yes stop_codon:yes gene_type:complete
MEKSEKIVTEQQFIVGLGASAGGLEALEAFFSQMPVDSGISFVVIQHLAPDFKSLMDELLTRHTTMAIHKAENNMRVEPNSIYLIPPKKEMIINNRHLILRDRNPAEGLNLPIDIFFHSLAKDAENKAIGIIFSGTGSDGSKGIAAIHENNGFILCQTPESAAFDGMPNSAIATGVVDAIVNPNEMPEILTDYSKHTLEYYNFDSHQSKTTEYEIYSPIFAKLNTAYDVDFQYYKPSTIGRRIERRMTLNRIHTVNDYIDFVSDESNNELELLYKDLLIGVTQFFRDVAIWEFIESEIIPEICAKCTTEREIRIWVPACATGEEAYSFAILAHEWFTKNSQPVNIRVFATDLHRGSLAYAGAGIYSEASLAEIEEGRRNQYFTKTEDGNYEISAEIRRFVVFAHHNVLKDPPFTKLDLVSCRNLLIYFLPHAQKRILNLFHFSLQVNGVFVMGPSESIGDLSNEYDEMHRRYKIYKKKRDIKLSLNHRGIQTATPLTSGNIPLKETQQKHGVIGGRDINLIKAYDTLLQQYAPPSLLIESNGQLAHTFGDATDYLHTPTGVPSLNITDIIHPDLRMAVATGIQRTNKDSAPVSYGGIKVNLKNNETKIIRVSFRALSNYKPSDYLIITLEEANKVVDIIPATLEAPPPQIDNKNQQEISFEHVKNLEDELRYTKENLQATVEELETSNEELQATNEELMASNEELQSTNEELHSVNEELYTVNREYEEKIHELTQLTDDMDNLLASTDIGTIFLDQNLKIRKFTPASARQFSLISQDIGRPISHLNRNIEFDNFHLELERTLKTGSPSSFEVKNHENSWFLMALNPYKDDSNQTTGVVITFVDITLSKLATNEITQRNEDLQSFAYAISHDINEPARILTKFSEILIEDLGKQDDKQINNHITEINNASLRLKGMLNGTLQFSRVITQGERFIDSSLLQCVDDAKSELKNEINLTNTNIICEELPPIQCDPKQIRRVFFELLSNSIKFRKHGIDPKVNITYENDNNNCIIFFEDNGIGISPTIQDKIFQIFYKGHSSSEIPGMGIGLAVAKRIVERHQGTLACNPSDNDKGASIVISFPIIQQ